MDPTSRAATDAVDDDPERPRSTLPGRGLVPERWQAWRVLLGAAWVGVLAAVVLTGVRDTGWAELTQAVRAGEVDRVEVVGGLPEGARGTATVEVLWRDGLLRRSTEVVERRPLRASPDGTPLGPRGSVGRGLRAADGSPPVVPDVGAALTALDAGSAPGLVLERGEASQASWHTEVRLAGFRTGGTLAGAALVLLVLTVLLLVRGPEPRRATRWAWWWILLTLPPLGLAAYLLLGGPGRSATGDEPAGAGRDGRLTGGWAFLLTVLLGSASSSLL